jgi:hypothetical protein
MTVGNDPSACERVEANHLGRYMAKYKIRFYFCQYSLVRHHLYNPLDLVVTEEDPESLGKVENELAVRQGKE